MSATDYLSYLRQKGKATVEQRIQLLLNDATWEPVPDLFTLQGSLIQPFRQMVKDTYGNKYPWNLDSLFRAYLGEALSFESPGNSFKAVDVTSIVRDSLHRLRVYAGRGCNVLAYYQYEPARTSFYTTSIPFKIYESCLTPARPNEIKLRRVK